MPYPYPYPYPYAAKLLRHPSASLRGAIEDLPQLAAFSRRELKSIRNHRPRARLSPAAAGSTPTKLTDLDMRQLSWLRPQNEPDSEIELWADIRMERLRLRKLAEFKEQQR